MFDKKYAKCILKSRNNTASWFEKTNGKRANDELQQLIQPYLLQRDIKNYLKDKLKANLHQIVVWIGRSVEQERRYQQICNSSFVRDVISGETNSPLLAISRLKQLCGHPILLEKTPDEQHALLQDLDARQREDIIRQAPKLRVLVDLVHNEISHGNRILIFSHSVRILNIIQAILNDTTNWLRIDGSTPTKRRQKIVDKFNEDQKYHIILLSTKATGLGLTITGGNRIISRYMCN